MMPVRYERQRGATLLVALIMLVVLTLFVVSAISSSNTNLRIAGNMQIQNESAAAAQQAIEQVISSIAFTTSTTAQNIPVDVNNDGTAEYTVTVQPVCLSSVPIRNSELDPNNPSDLSCMGSGFGQPISMCYKQQWDIQATVRDSHGASVAEPQHQGVFVRVPADTACS
jgi:hypothetical protein